MDSRRTATGRGVPRPSLVGGSLVESLRRHLLVLVAVVLGLGATAVAALVLGFVDLSGSPSRLPDRHDGQAWYLHQTPPPQLVDLPDSPLLPDPPHDGGARAAPAPARAPLMRPYEEALPTESYEPIRIPMPIPGRDAPARSAPPTPPAPTPTLTPPVGPPRSLLPDGAAPPGPESPA
ncbi:MAG: hypothetical protein KDE22_07725, partial [Rhodobacterales bacterium]|nr:hypothetical protein [Rhodobacterales bacterium]